MGAGVSMRRPKLALGHGAVQYVNNHPRKAFTAFKGKPLGTATFPTTDVGNYVRRLARFRGVRYVPSSVQAI